MWRRMCVSMIVGTVDQLIDSLVAEFALEIGPARDRASSRRYEAWVLQVRAPSAILNNTHL